MTPKLRFKGFDDAWEQRKFGDMTIRESKTGESSKNLPCVEYEDVVCDNGVLNKDLSLKDAIKKGILFDGSQVLYGKLRPYLHNWLLPDFKGVAVGDWWVLRPKGVDKKFIYRLIQTQQFDDVTNLSSGSKMPRADWKLVSNTEFAIPCSTEEQMKIGLYFEHLDNLITLHQRQCEALKKQKQFFLQNMFPKEGESEPRIRFNGFTEPWEQRKLGEISALITKGTTPKDKSGLGEVNFVKVESIDPSLGKITCSSKISATEHNNYLKRSQLKDKDILFSIAGTLGRVGIVNRDILPANTNQALAIIRLNKGNVSYVSTYLKGKAVENFIRKNPTVGAQPNLSLEQVSNLIIDYPSSQEQVKIGSYFEHLDNLITLHQQLYEQLVSLKKYLLSKMFI